MIDAADYFAHFPLQSLRTLSHIFVKIYELNVDVLLVYPTVSTDDL